MIRSATEHPFSKFWKRNLDKIGIGGSVFAALCCLGFPALLSILSVIGLGFIVNDTILLPLLLFWPSRFLGCISGRATIMTVGPHPWGAQRARDSGRVSRACAKPHRCVRGNDWLGGCQHSRCLAQNTPTKQPVRPKQVASVLRTGSDVHGSCAGLQFSLCK
jgi:hypothetical protein